MEEIARIIKERRLELKMRQLEVCAYAEISMVTLTKLENGKGWIAFKTVQKILDVLDLKMEIRPKEDGEE